MIALSIRQPWASLILEAGKDIENRCWSTKYRGPFLIHAAKGMTRTEFRDAMQFAEEECDVLNFNRYEDMQRGGIVGCAEIVDCVKASTSPWFMGEYGFVLRKVRPLPFVPFKGALGFFNVPDELVRATL